MYSSFVQIDTALLSLFDICSFYPAVTTSNFSVREIGYMVLSANPMCRENLKMFCVLLLLSPPVLLLLLLLLPPLLLLQDLQDRSSHKLNMHLACEGHLQKGRYNACVSLSSTCPINLAHTHQMNSLFSQ